MMVKIRNIHLFTIRHLILVFLLLSLFSCSKNEATLRLAHLSWPGYEALSLAKNRNLYKKLDVITYRPSTAEQTFLSLKNNVVDVIALTLIHAIELQNKFDEPLLVFAILDVSHGGNVLIANKNIKTIPDLIDKRIGVAPDAFGAYFISRALGSIPNFPINKVHFVPVTIDNHYQFFLKNKVDAVATYEPAKSKILKKKGHVLFDSRKIPNEIVDVLITKKSYADNNPQLLSRLIDGYFNALELMKKEPDKSIEEMARYEHVSAEEYKRSLAGIHIPNREENKTLLRGKNSKLKKTAEQLLQFMKNNHILKKSKDLLPNISDKYL